MLCSPPSSSLSLLFALLLAGTLSPPLIPVPGHASAQHHHHRDDHDRQVTLTRHKRQQQSAPSQSDLMLLSAALNRGTPVTLANFSAIDNPDIGHVIRDILQQLNATAAQVRQRPQLPAVFKFDNNANNQRNTGTRVTRVTRINLNGFTPTNRNGPGPTTTTSRPNRAVTNSNKIDNSPGERVINTRQISRQAPRQRRNEREGKIRLVGGETLFEGNVEINHMGQWGSICDDEWDMAEANVVCKQLGFVLGAMQATTDSRYGKSRRLIWMDNLFCAGFEEVIQDCAFTGWKKHDCGPNEAAGVRCRTQHNLGSEQTALSKLPRSTPKPENNGLSGENPKLMSLFGNDIQVRLVGERVDHQGRIEVRVNKQWQVVCGDGWSLNEAQVVCKQLGLGFAENVLHLRLADHEQFSPIFSGIACNGNEAHISECSMPDSGRFCPDSYDNIAGITCVPDLPDLILDTFLLEESAYLEDRSILFLQCAMEENCLAKSAYELDKSDPNWIYETRRLLRFTAAIRNIGRVDFRPFAPKQAWVWHSCHRHYHSMEVFAHFDVLDQTGNRIAEGHKASFCLEDNDCQEGSTARYQCANYGDQGISVGCVDIYKYDLDCQWIDISDISPGEYFLKITINPEFKVPEMTFDNNAALCRFYYTPVGGYVTNCTVVRP